MSTAFDLSTSYACLAPGTIIGRYRILRRLAVGGMAEIYLATATGIEGFEKRIALKRILPQFASIPEFVGMFLDEARLAGRLHHPNIAQVYDIGSDGTSYYFTMEHVDGRDVRHLRKALRVREESMPLEHAIAITMGVAAGLHAAHETRGSDGALLRVVHRDVSPANILVGFDGSVKLIDFGIARSDRRQTQTRVGVLKGKTCHMSPEQCLGEPLDRRSDVFSLGILLYELTTDGRLFGGENEYETMRLIVDGRVPPPALRRPGYPTALEDIVMRALERDPADRYQTAGEMYVALERFARVQGLRVDPFSLSAWLAELCPRSEAAVEDGSDAAPLFLVPERELPPELRIREVEITGEFEGDAEVAFDRARTVERGSMTERQPRPVPRAVSPDSDGGRDRKATVNLHVKEDTGPGPARASVPVDPFAGLQAAGGGVGEEERAVSASELADTQDVVDPPTALIRAELGRVPASPPRRRGLGAAFSVVAAAAAGAAAVWVIVQLAGGSRGTAAASVAAAPAVTAPVAAAERVPGPAKATVPAATVPATTTTTTPSTTSTSTSGVEGKDVAGKEVAPVAPKLVRRKVRRAAVEKKPVTAPAAATEAAPAEAAPAAPAAEPAAAEAAAGEGGSGRASPPQLLDVPVSAPGVD